MRGNNDLMIKYQGEKKLQTMLEDLIFEILYPQIFNKEEDLIAKSIEIQEKLLVLQNMITPDLLEIPQECRMPSFLLHLQNGLEKKPPDLFYLFKKSKKLMKGKAL